MEYHIYEQYAMWRLSLSKSHRNSAASYQATAAGIENSKIIPEKMAAIIIYPHAILFNAISFSITIKSETAYGYYNHFFLFMIIKLFHNNNRIQKRKRIYFMPIHDDDAMF